VARPVSRGSGPAFGDRCRPGRPAPSLHGRIYGESPKADPEPQRHTGKRLTLQELHFIAARFRVYSPACKNR